MGKVGRLLPGDAGLLLDDWTLMGECATNGAAEPLLPLPVGGRRPGEVASGGVPVPTPPPPPLVVVAGPDDDDGVKAAALAAAAAAAALRCF